MAAYEGMWAAFVAAGTTANWQDPALAAHATGLALSTLTRGLYADAYNGLVTRGEPILDPVVSSVEPEDEPTTVVVADCGDDSDWLKYTADGQLADDVPGGRREINAIVERQADGAWKVSDFGVHGVGTC
ncbi:hypothetical protein FHR81_003238 [Actinoalloteichus hoggarensis]|uniref:Uncharacterized protein n=1 Tax=Actinoalloteichus hoggarensis TaxID=1470176 RepID=A0A221W763_9PSEU|nr:hypothetical protein [Actinoalloteichus hoggarensis]ASO21594.1 hypothetical protein AHOG_19880 [Actinoalloteichus hoggarensis]MBB5922186.1 hypothetical protein [Actinoalloteichus hoggarensis]